LSVNCLMVVVKGKGTDKNSERGSIHNEKSRTEK